MVYSPTNGYPSFLPRCMECSRGIAMGILSVRPSPRSQLRKEMWLTGEKYDWLATWSRLKKAKWLTDDLSQYDWRRRRYDDFSRHRHNLQRSPDPVAGFEGMWRGKEKKGRGKKTKGNVKGGEEGGKGEGRKREWGKEDEKKGEKGRKTRWYHTFWYKVTPVSENRPSVT